MDQCVLVQMLWLTLYSAGVGRTGTFICIDNVLEQIKKEKVVDIAGAINKMRHQRMKMVQTHVRLYIRRIHYIHSNAAAVLPFNVYMHNRISTYSYMMPCWSQ